MSSWGREFHRRMVSGKNSPPPPSIDVWVLGMANRLSCLHVHYIPFRGRPASCRDSSTALLRSSSKLELPPAEKKMSQEAFFSVDATDIL